MFSFGTILDLFARLVMNSFGDGWVIQILVNVLGLAGVYGVAVWLDRHRRQAALMAGETRKEAREEAKKDRDAEIGDANP